MDIVVLIFVLGALAVLIFKRPVSFVYYIAIFDIFLRILSFLSDNLPIKFITNFFDKYFPDNLSSIIDSYSSGIFTTVLSWGLLIIYILFLYYIIKSFLSKK